MDGYMMTRLVCGALQELKFVQQSVICLNAVVLVLWYELALIVWKGLH